MTHKIVAFGFAAATLLASAADAYVLLSPRRVWKNTPVNVQVYTKPNTTIADGSGGVAKTAAAINTWGVVNSSTSNSAPVRGDGVARIDLSNNGHICNGSCLAATLTGYYHAEGGSYYIDDADVYTNTKYKWTSTGEADGCSGEFYVEGVMVHEVGHVIGIGHSNVNGATMYPSVSYCDNGPASLANDDTAAKNDLY